MSENTIVKNTFVNTRKQADLVGLGTPIWYLAQKFILTEKERTGSLSEEMQPSSISYSAQREFQISFSATFRRAEGSCSSVTAKNDILPVSYTPLSSGS